MSSTQEPPAKRQCAEDASPLAKALHGYAGLHFTLMSPGDNPCDATMYLVPTPAFLELVKGTSLEAIADLDKLECSLCEVFDAGSKVNIHDRIYQDHFHKSYGQKWKQGDSEKTRTCAHERAMKLIKDGCFPCLVVYDNGF